MKYVVSEHAVEQYVARVKPALTLRRAKIEIEGLIQRLDCPVQAEPPYWVKPAPEHVGQDYLILCEGIAFPLVHGRLVTCLVAGCTSEATKANRKAKKERRRKQRAQRGFKQTLSGRARDEDWAA